MDAQGVVGWLLDEVPLAVVLVVVGGITAWRSFTWDASAARER